MPRRAAAAVVSTTVTVAASSPMKSSKKKSSSSSSSAAAPLTAAAAALISGSTIAQRLASCNLTARNRAVRDVPTWLNAAADVSDDDLLKIWKGLFYCVWHSDKAPAQLDLITRLSSLLPSLPAPLALRYFTAFLETIRREWPGIDFLRLDKFYLLIRKFVRHLFLFLAAHSWEASLVRETISIVSDKSLLADAGKKHPAQGVNYHISEVFFDELLELLPVDISTLSVLLAPFHEVLAKSLDKVMISKVKTSVFDRLLVNGVNYLKLSGDGEKVESEVEKLGKIGLVMGFAKKFFDSASAEETVQGNRKVLFGLHEMFQKLERDLDKSGVAVTIDAVRNGKQVETANGGGGEGLVDKPAAKKRKKSSGSVEKKSKTKKKSSATKTEDTIPNGSSDTAIDMESDAVTPISLTDNGEAAAGDGEDEYDMIAFDEPLISNLQKQFEKVAAESGMTTPAVPVTKKRKRAKSANGKATVSPGTPNGGSVSGKTGDKSAKKVSFAMKNNIVWKPQTPLPPQSLRLPPSATPRGSALKKGVPPGPIKMTPLSGKKGNSNSSSGKKKGRKLKSGSPSVKRITKK